MKATTFSLLALALLFGLIFGLTAACGGGGSGAANSADDDASSPDDDDNDDDDNDNDDDDDNDDNDDNDDSSPSDDDTTAPFGACCQGASCTMTQSQDCPGVWKGADTVCVPSPCLDDDNDDNDNDNDNDDTSPTDDDDDVVCDPATCLTGCCDASGVCQPGTANGACGADGGDCAVCSADNECTGQACVANCAPGDCNTGCCDGTSCVAGTSNDECGTLGAACVACPAGQECIGLDMDGGACGCDAASCPLGCCNGASCEAGTADDQCGVDGAACAACAATNYCVSRQCEQSYALSFDGVADYVDVPDVPSLRLTGPMTIEAWVYINSIPNTGVASIAIKGDHSGNSPDHGWRVGINDGFLQFVIMNDAADTATASAPPPLNRWVHIAGTYDRVSVVLWQDGALVQSTPATLVLAASTADLLMAKDCNPNPYFDGVVDEVRLSNVARYGAPFTPANRFAPDADTVALWHFDEDQGTTLDDASGNGHTGTINGATWTAGH